MQHCGIRYLRIKVALRAIGDCILPKSKTPALRGGIGEMLLRQYCVNDRACEDCEYTRTCLVQRVMYSGSERAYFLPIMGRL